MLGYGTQFAPELDEEERIVDSPVPKAKTKKAEEHRCAECDELLRPYAGMNGGTVSVEKHCKASVAKYGKPLCLTCIEKKKKEEGAKA